jgi:hypothetical protein
MIAIISPAKTLDPSPLYAHTHTLPVFLKESKTLVNLLKKKKVKDLMNMMGISEKLADLNVKRYKSFDSDFNLSNSSTSILTFKGDVYLGLKAEEMDESDLDFAQDKLRIISGLYGVLKPLDLMQAYRLEMGISLENRRGSNLYKYWGDSITKELNKDIEIDESRQVINLASNEYFKAINTKKLKAQIYDIQFLDEKNGKRIFISFNAKKARGLMAAYIIRNRLSDVEQLKAFNSEGYSFDQEASTDKQFVFVKYQD